MLIRPILSSDRNRLDAFVRGLSTASRFNRFHGGLASLSDEQLDRATCIDYATHFALVALVDEVGDERIVGSARYVATDTKEAGDFALVVADEWHRDGLGEELLSSLLAIAAANGLSLVEGDVLAGNHVMLNLVRKLGFADRAVANDAGLRRVSRTPLLPESSR